MAVGRVTLYFERAGVENTDKVFEAAKNRIVELGLRHLVVASTTGWTGLKVADCFKDLKDRLNVVVVTHAGAAEYSEESRERLKESWVKMLTCPHVLGWGLGDALRSRYQGFSLDRVVAEAFRRFGEGMKVAVEITMMATDAGLIPPGEDVLAMAGTGRGSDTAIVIKSSCTRNFLDLKIREVVAMPR